MATAPVICLAPALPPLLTGTGTLFTYRTMYQRRDAPSYPMLTLRLSLIDAPEHFRAEREATPAASSSRWISTAGPRCYVPFLLVLGAEGERPGGSTRIEILYDQ
ncbi:hypothetical protein BD309DRAFT_984648 [Dichomitus squalens]|nr:hypothetical protein BD309DRAFT_984648 [Dichomitus squalens]